MMKNKMLILTAMTGVCTASSTFAMELKEETYAFVKKSKLGDPTSNVRVLVHPVKNNEVIQELKTKWNSSVLIFPIGKDAQMEEERLAAPCTFFKSIPYHQDFKGEEPWFTLLANFNQGNVKMDNCRILERWDGVLLVEDRHNPFFTIEGRSYYPARVFYSENNGRVLEIPLTQNQQMLTYHLDEKNRTIPSAMITDSYDTKDGEELREMLLAKMKQALRD